MDACKAPSSFCFNCCKVDNACLKSDLRCTGIVSERVLFEPTSNYFSNGNILVGSNGGYDLRPQEHPFVDKYLRFDHFQLFDCGIVHLV